LHHTARRIYSGLGTGSNVGAKGARMHPRWAFHYTTPFVGRSAKRQNMTKSLPQIFVEGS
jgi:hypothetical protein